MIMVEENAKKKDEEVLEQQSETEKEDLETKTVKEGDIKIEEEDGLEENIEEEVIDVEELEEEIAKLQEEKDAFFNQLQRLQADFSNYKKRVEKEKGRAYQQTKIELIGELLPVIDNFERALAQEDNGGEFYQGVEMIYRQIITYLEKQGVKAIEAEGEQFDHNYHEAVMQVEDDDYESGTIIKEIQKGYIMEDRVIRPTMVKVAQ
ncbi:nucleotide exchange factor GrpE [Halocella sp. SP3-1]|uniref:nucleotide exchange factor GrpE n=1 Tax=Halocella sp. SP3-1 TaxID=2382161 RepID=UPI002570AD8C|nr:nucleotide exchange factor GrpE [Halocella sp. SP3-1]